MRSLFPFHCLVPRFVPDTIYLKLVLACAMGASCLSELTPHGCEAAEMITRAGSHRPNDHAEMVRLPSVVPPPPESEPLRRYRRGFFQGIEVAGESVLSTSNDLDLAGLDLSASFAVPLGSFERLLIITPTMNLDTVELHSSLDVPETLYETGVRFFLMSQLNERWKFIGMAQPMLRSDGHASDQALRLFALGLLNWEAIPDKLQLSFGAVHLGRNDIPLLPALGLVWTPTPDLQLDATFPRPRLAYRLVHTPSLSEQWIYLGGALGGNTWAVQRDSGVDDQLSLRDYRLVLGMEWLRQGGRNMFVEGGYVFGRSLEYETGGEQLNFSDGLLLRGGIRF